MLVMEELEKFAARCCKYICFQNIGTGMGRDLGPKYPGEPQNIW
jgi:hypothetical protein